MKQPLNPRKSGTDRDVSGPPVDLVIAHTRICTGISAA